MTSVESIETYIQTLPDEALDRIIEAQNWCTGAVLSAGDNRCLVGHAEDWTDVTNYPLRTSVEQVTLARNAAGAFDALGNQFSALPVDHPAVQICKHFAAEEIEKRHGLLLGDASGDGEGGMADRTEEGVAADASSSFAGRTG